MDGGESGMDVTTDATLATMETEVFVTICFVFLVCPVAMEILVFFSVWMMWCNITFVQSRSAHSIIL